MIQARFRETGLFFASTESGSAELAGCRILLIDDDKLQRDATPLFLRIAGANVSTAQDGASGIEMVMKAKNDGNPFAIVLMDLTMPVMNGYETTKQLRCRGIKEPIIAVSGNFGADEPKKVLDAGCDDFVAKIDIPERLVPAILKLWKNSR